MGFPKFFCHCDPEAGEQGPRRTLFDKNPFARQPLKGVRFFFKLLSLQQTTSFGKPLIHTRVSTLRPCRRRRLIILRPFAVFILLRKPWIDLRRRLLG